MVWIHASDKLPEDNEEVLIRFETMLHLAVFQKEQKAFRLRNGEKIKIDNHRIQWMRLTGP
jgi:hypothetical protein